jgi:hypothetical protein
LTLRRKTLGKVDDMRAMREARFSARAKRVAELAALRGEVRETLLNKAEELGNLSEVQDILAEELCGHQSISKARCTRPKDHPEKNHRYK